MDKLWNDEFKMKMIDEQEDLNFICPYCSKQMIKSKNDFGVTIWSCDCTTNNSIIDKPKTKNML